jgi:hypothetical protein
MDADQRNAFIGNYGFALFDYGEYIYYKRFENIWSSVWLGGGVCAALPLGF